MNLATCLAARSTLITTLVLCMLLLGRASAVAATPLGTAFTYQGLLKQSGVPANGEVDLKFGLFDAGTGGNQLGPTLTVTHLDLVAGHFTIDLDFGSGIFNGDRRWLQIQVRKSNSQNPNFNTLNPRQSIMVAPYALYALNGGMQGPPGPVGPQGSQGSPGTAGPAGATGSAGAAGPQGAVGSVGPQGQQGAPGDAGSIGATGSQGATGAQGPQGDPGADGADGAEGAEGGEGQACWDLNGNGVGDLPTEDINGDFMVDALDCRGATGATGPEGSAGPQGDTGAAGAQGVAGPQGSQGDAGVTGAQGAQGETGAQGPQGDIGPQGVQGLTGTDGDDGATGPQGPQGDPGATGTTGAQGPQGDTGVMGPIGPQGETGATGAQGDSGAMGANGAQGMQGLQGDTGATGATGAQGTQGETGAPGPQGDTGAAGAIGPQGPAGADGATGPQGAAGVDGATGPQGSPGDTGATGAIGPQGDPGTTGPQGSQGDTGAPGATGANGSQGPNGATGPQGPQGPTGASPWALNGSNTNYMPGLVSVGTTTPAVTDLFTASTSSSTINTKAVFGDANSSLSTGNIFGVYGQSLNGVHSVGVRGVGRKWGVEGETTNLSGGGAIGVYGHTGLSTSTSGYGMWAETSSVTGVGLRARNLSGDNGAGIAIYATNNASNPGTNIPFGPRVIQATAGGAGVTTGVHGTSTSSVGVGVYAQAGGYGVYGSAVGGTPGIGVYGVGSTRGVEGQVGPTLDNASGVYGHTGISTFVNVNGVMGQTINGIGVRAHATGGGTGVYALTTGTGSGVHAQTTGAGARAVYASASGSDSTAVYAVRTGGSGGHAGYFVGDVQVIGTLSATDKQFRIDHPLDPANKYLVHACVESPDMKNIYDGVISTDGNGYATVTMPDYFDALNRDFCYQLTVIGDFAQAIIAEEIDDNHFIIRTSKPSMKVSWQVTGVRQDAWAQQNRIEVEQDKPQELRGTYLNPEAFGESSAKGENRASETLAHGN